MRSFEQALALPASDLAAATALLDARFLVGDEALAGRFLDAFRARIAETAAQDFISRLRAEQRARHGHRAHRLLSFGRGRRDHHGL